MDATLEQRRYAKGLAVRDKAVTSACQRFALQGYGGCSVADLAAAAGITRNQLFHHFNSKENLSLACVERARQCWWDDVLTPAKIYPEPIKRLVYILSKLAECHSDPDWPYARLLLVLAVSQADPPPAVGQAVQATLVEIFQELRTVLKELKRGSPLPGGFKARAVAAQLLASLLGAAALASLGDTIPTNEIYDNLSGLFTANTFSRLKASPPRDLY
jgi:AcrR family transcriptional regulator